MSVGYDTDRTTYSNNLIYEGLYDPYGDGSDHNYATLVGDGATRVALLGNVWSKVRNRVPRLKSDTTSVVANNFAYFFDEACSTDGSAETAWVGNKFTGTAATGESIVEGSGTVYGEDNVTADPQIDSDVDFVKTGTVGSKPLWPPGFSAMSSSRVEQHNLANPARGRPIGPPTTSGSSGRSGTAPATTGSTPSTATGSRIPTRSAGTRTCR
ncbi:hypothetical protein [Halomicrobium urmianum]|uniref:hypothetical protein n=1 Tax=Halomicrobium urmianum TaxID=1586233 RepID=UPI001CD9BBF6|nr:hypothetical protein [Halomicrobium urmianum]